MSTDPDSTSRFGPFTPGFKIVPYGDLEAVKAAITPYTVGIFMEPIQGEGGVIIPPKGFLKGLREIADQNNCLLVLDEIQSGLGRTASSSPSSTRACAPTASPSARPFPAATYPSPPSWPVMP